MSSADDRRMHVLRAIIADYVASKEPVGSKALVDKHNLGVSSATIRNDMSVLESQGLITQPHTSSGRIPTEKGYRFFVDSINEIKPLSRAETSAIYSFLEQSDDVDDVLQRAVRVLSQLTSQVAMIQYPSMSESTILRLEVVDIAPTKLLFVVINDTGQVEQCMVDVPHNLDTDGVATVRDLFCTAIVGKRLSEAKAQVLAVAAGADPLLKDTTRVCALALTHTLMDKRSERMVLGGTANLTEQAADFDGNLRGVLEALEEQVVVLKLLSSAHDLQQQHAAGRVMVTIGEENAIKTASVVSTSYGAEKTSLGSLGVLGPTRMDYSGTISHVAAVAHYVGQILRGD